MKVAICQRVCPEYHLPLFERLARAHDVDFIFSRFGQREEFFFNERRLGPIRARGLRPLPLPLLPSRSRVVNKLSYLAHAAWLVPQLLVALRRGRYDVVVGGDYGRFECVVAWLYAWLARRPFVLWSDAWRWPVTRRDRARVPLVKAMIRTAVVLIATGTKCVENLRALGAGATPIYNAFFFNITPRPYRRRPDPERFVLFVGRLEPRKGPGLLLRAFAAVRAVHPDVRLKMVGRGALREPLGALAVELGIADAVEFVGWVDHEAIDDYYERCAVLVLPSVFTPDGGYEPFGNVVVEAMACAAPVITTTATGAGWDAVESGVNGLVVPAGDEAALARALRQMLDDPAGAEALGRRGRHSIETTVNVDRMAGQFVAALDEVARRLGAGDAGRRRAPSSG